MNNSRSDLEGIYFITFQLLPEIFQNVNFVATTNLFLNWAQNLIIDIWQIK